ncbi:MAG TPA: hypothetical protein PLQ52_10435 [Lacunisphaera sp.]|jgi:hypothetical protein|nr:hypothetical protein [Lacunisphaera sp.]HQY06470.1 hypothetical protein [Lacunisphaera sp.]
MRAYLLICLGAMLLTGCESVTDRFSPVAPRVQVFHGDRFAVHAAALQAFKRLDFLVTRSKPMDIEAVSRIHTSVAFADSRQLAVKLHLNEAGPDGTELEMSVTEQVQGERMGGTSQLAMREHGFFQLYFATLQQVLEENAIGRSSEKN